MREMMLVGSNIMVSSCAQCFTLNKLSETGEPYYPVNPAFEEGEKPARKAGNSPQCSIRYVDVAHAYKDLLGGGEESR
jgi:hypothetical protein